MGCQEAVGGEGPRGMRAPVTAAMMGWTGRRTGQGASRFREDGHSNGLNISGWFKSELCDAI